MKSAESLEKHRKQYHTGEIPLLKCPYENCDQTSVNADSLKKHIDWHKDIEKKKKKKGKNFFKRQKQHNEELKKTCQKKIFTRSIKVLSSKSDT